MNKTTKKIIAILSMPTGFALFYVSCVPGGLMAHIYIGPALADGYASSIFRAFLGAVLGIGLMLFGITELFFKKR